MRSMTGFGQAQGENRRHRVAVAVRGVNHRFLDIALRIREEYRASEAALREVVSRDVARGRMEVGVEIQFLGEPEAQVEVQQAVVRALHEACRELAEQGLITRELAAGDLLRLPEALRVRVVPEAWERPDQDLLEAVAGRAVEQFLAARRHEGERLAVAMAERLAELEAVVAQIALRRPEVRRELGEALRARLDELLQGPLVPEERLAQEVAVLVDRSDIQEELDRLGAHLAHLRQVMAEEGAVGKRLDFLVQEIFRELNTIGSKARDAQTVRWVLDAKALCEQLREQAQNVE